MNHHFIQSINKIRGKYSANFSNHKTWSVHIDICGDDQDRISIYSESWHLAAKIQNVIAIDERKREVRAEIDYAYSDNENLDWTKNVSLKLVVTDDESQVSQNIHLILSHPDQNIWETDLEFISTAYDKISIRMDAEKAALPIFTDYELKKKTGSGSVQTRVVNIESIFEDVGFDVNVEPTGVVKPLISSSYALGAIKGRWSNQEMHNAMVDYWQNSSDTDPWAMWAFYAALHEEGPEIGGVMFDDIGEKHRQGIAIFTKSFIHDVGSVTNAALAQDIRNQMQFFTTVHEIGHGFNLNHSWNKNSTQAWIPQTNDRDALSFMNYPHKWGNSYLFFKSFEFSFDKSELAFMRHAPRNFVRPGGTLRGVNHSFKQPEFNSNYHFRISAFKGSAIHEFMEPVKIDMMLRNQSNSTAHIHQGGFNQAHDIRIYVQRAGGPIKKWRPMEHITSNQADTEIEPGEAIYGSSFISFTTSGWIIDEPGEYKIQAVYNMEGILTVSNVLSISVLPGTPDEVRFADKYFTEDVGRILYFQGAPSLEKANETLSEFIDLSVNNKEFNTGSAALFADIALNDPLTRDFNFLSFDSQRDNKLTSISTRGADISTAAKTYAKWLSTDPETAISTIRFDSDDVIDTTRDALKELPLNPQFYDFIDKTLELKK